MRLTVKARRLVALVLLASLLVAACSGSTDRSTEFCERLLQATGPNGVESVLVAGDPARLDGVVAELDELHARAPEEISATTRAMLRFFESYQQAPRTERRQLIAENEALLAEASSSLDAYSLRECGLLLQRAVPTPPTPVPTINPIIEAPTE